MRAWPHLYQPPAPDFVVPKNLRLFDSYKKKCVEISDSKISSYVCGITPYDATHLGHAATYITFDLIHRYLLASGRELSFTENITDIDDPLLERANRDKQDWRNLATSQIDLFISDMSALRVIPPQNYLGVIESMTEIIESIETYLKRELAYRVAEDLYLDLSSVKGALENLPMSTDEALQVFRERGGDPDRAGKRNPLDPLLWRGARAGEPSWNAPFGAGRPGWHVECVAIALKSLPDTGATSITLQGGGSDLFFPHHYMTASQAKALTNKEFAACYSHAGMIGLDGEKMSKSKGNLVFVSQLLKSGIKPEEIRIALMMNHYQSDRMWNSELLESARILSNKISSSLSRSEVAPSQNFIQEIVDALADNLDTQKVLNSIKDWCDKTDSGITGGSAGEVSRALDTYLGLGY